MPLRNLAAAVGACMLAGCSLVLSIDREFRDVDAGYDDAGSDSGPQDAGPCGRECTGSAPICNAVTQMCVECMADVDCEDRDPCTLDRCGVSVGTCTHVADTTCIAQISAGGT